jgi:two-component system phosphate regulon sensor histidine kinase PhoR
VQETVPGLWPVLEPIFQRVLAGETVADREISLGDRTYLLNARPLPAGGSVVVLHDLTRLRRLETVRRDFVANVSHELKTPLTAISGYAETLLTDQPEPEVARQFLDTILANARRMQRLVDDQLDLSRIESGGWQPALEPVDVDSVAREAWRHALPPTGGSPVFTVSIDEPVRVVDVDPDALRQVFRNLFENAIRHTPAGGAITVTGKAEGDMVHLAVSDTGMGIPSEHLPRIFERFYRVDPGRSRAQGGTGLGLAIVKHLIEGHGGRVSATSELGQGTTIHTWWPVHTG